MDRSPRQDVSNQFAHKHILKSFLDSYLVQRNAEKTLSLVTEDIYSLGTGKQEVAHNKAEFHQLLYAELEQLSEPLSYTISAYQEKTIVPNVFVCICDVTTCMQQGTEQPIYFATRLTAGFRETDGVFLAYHLHMSEASAMQQEYEFFPLHYGEKQASKINTEKQIELVELMKRMLPGGAMGGFVEPGFPLYFVNDELLNLLGYTYEEFIAENGQMMANTMHPDDVATVETTIMDCFAVGNEYAVEYRIKKKDHSYIWVRDMGRKTITEDGRVAMISVIADISDEKARQQSFERIIASMKKERRRVDRMTGLLNREPAEILIEQHLVRERRGVFFLMDIDNFKLVNDTKGHPAGDLVLHTLADQLKRTFPEDTVLARLGGDEFIAFLPQYKDRQQLRQLAQKVLTEADQLTSDTLLIRKIGVSIGIAIAPEHGTDIKALHANADKGLYYAKRNGKNRYSFYEQASALPEASEQHPTLHTLRRMVQGVLVDRGAFMVEYDTFNKICQFALRNEKRLQQATQIVLFTLHGGAAETELLTACKKLLEQSIRYGLRIGDLMMDFSDNQIAVLLVNCNLENAVHVAERVSEAYRHTNDAEIPVTFECGSINEEPQK